VLLVGDLLATGGTAAASIALLEGLEADIVAVTVLIELGFLYGRSKLLPHQFHAILDF
jgi:adenine phosphoribosyltransferase